MNMPALGLAAALLLGGTSLAYAQRGPDEGPSRAGPAMERGPAGGGSAGERLRGDAGRGDGPGAVRAGSGASERRSEGPDPDTRKGAPDPEPSGATRKDSKGGKAGQRTGEGLGERAKQRERTADDLKGADRKGREGRGDTARDDSPRGDKGRDKAQDKAGDKAREAKGKDAHDRDAADKAADKTDKTDKAKSADRARDDSDKRDKDAAESDKAKPADADKQAAGKHRPPDEAKKVDLSGERQERVRTAFRERRDVRHRTDVDIDISVGTRLPRDWDFVPVPVDVVEVVPEYEGYVFAYVGDEYVICDPVTYEVVAVLPAPETEQYAGGGGASPAAERCTTSLALSDEERDLILRSVQLTDDADVANVTVGWTVPDNITLKRFPEPVVERTDKLSACRYFVVDDQIAVVDPAEETVVLLIDPDDDRR